MKKVMVRQKFWFADEIDECCGEIEYRGGKVLQQWRGSGGNVCLSHLLIRFLYKLGQIGPQNNRAVSVERF